MSAKIEISAEQRQRAYAYYTDHPKITLQTIATFLGVSTTTLRHLRQRWNWPPRKAAKTETEIANSSAPMIKTTDSSAASVGAANDTSALRDAALSLAQVTRSHIAALVKQQRKGRGLDHDKTARTLASYAKTLTAARALLEQEGSTLDATEHHTRPARSIHELRDELAHHLERIIAEEEALGRDGLLV
jgi:hypothetical protein